MNCYWKHGHCSSLKSNEEIFNENCVGQMVAIDNFGSKAIDNDGSKAWEANGVTAAWAGCFL